MSFGKVSIDKADRAFSNYIREKAKWTCERCHKKCKIGGQTVARLEASHYFGRRKESVRFDEENVHALCASCHIRMGGYKKEEDGEYDIWMKELLGQRNYDLLMLRANTTGKKERQLEYIYWKAKLKELQKVSL